MSTSKFRDPTGRERVIEIVTGESRRTTSDPTQRVYMPHAARARDVLTFDEFPLLADGTFLDGNGVLWKPDSPSRG